MVVFKRKSIIDFIETNSLQNLDMLHRSEIGICSANAAAALLRIMGDIIPAHRLISGLREERAANVSSSEMLIEQRKLLGSDEVSKNEVFLDQH